jgi:predicted RNA-binding protein associated with RNAse of E/G family
MIHHVHPPKVETFDVLARTNTDNKSFVRPVQTYRTAPFGLYMSRAIEARPNADWIESWLLPSLSLRISKWWWKPGFNQDYDYYLDIVDITREHQRWIATDLYLDITVQIHHASRLLDIDEFAAAVAARLLSPHLAVRALEVSHATMSALASHANNLDEWLATEGITLEWRQAGDPS